MKGELLLLFLILLFGLILCSFLGGSGCREGMENNDNSSSTSSTAEIKTDTSGKKMIVITDSNGSITKFYVSDISSNTYKNSNGDSVKVVTASNGSVSVIVHKSDGSVVSYDLNKSSNDSDTNVVETSYDNYDHYSGTSMPTIFYGSNGGTARVIKAPNNDSIVITNKNGTTEIYYIDNANSDSMKNIKTYYGPNGGSAKIITDNNGKQAVEITTPNGSKLVYTGKNAYTYNSLDDTINQYDSENVVNGSDYNTVYSSNMNGPTANTISGPAGNTYSTYDSSAYYNSLPQGIPRSQIPSGQEDLYILKSQVVPPVCPKCPDVIEKCPDEFDVSKCPACPSCERCPEPTFECKKVVNYKAFNPDTMPIPVLSDFSSFGM